MTEKDKAHAYDRIDAMLHYALGHPGRANRDENETDAEVFIKQLLRERRATRPNPNYGRPDNFKL